MVYEHAVAHGKCRGFVAVFRNGGNDAGGFVPQHQRRFAPDIPRHDVARANAGGFRLHEDLAGLQLWNRTLFDANVVDIVQNDGAHRFGNAHGSITAFIPCPASSEANTSSISCKPAVREVNRKSGSSCEEISSYARRTSLLAK